MMIVICGTALCLITQLFLEPLLRFFGSPDNVLGYAKTYTRITSLGFPFLILAAGGGHLIRADGNPRFAMVCNLAGAVVNTVLDAVFVFGFHWGMAGCRSYHHRADALWPYGHSLPSPLQNRRTDKRTPEDQVAVCKENPLVGSRTLHQSNCHDGRSNRAQ